MNYLCSIKYFEKVINDLAFLIVFKIILLCFKFLIQLNFLYDAIMQFVSYQVT